jgi:pimeloyl-ACP methyl ester carboxylesterase
MTSQQSRPPLAIEFPPQQPALDIIALMDALKIEKAVLAGSDWVARTAGTLAAAVQGAAPDEEVMAALTADFAEVSTYLYGRRTYETMAVWETDSAVAEQSSLTIGGPRWPPRRCGWTWWTWWSCCGARPSWAAVYRCCRRACAGI